MSAESHSAGSLEFSVTRHTFKQDGWFVLTDSHGEIRIGNESGLGFYYNDTRFLSGYELRINGCRPVTLLASTESGYRATFVYTNLHLAQEAYCDAVSNTADSTNVIRPDTLEVRREILLKEGWFERISLTNYHCQPVQLTLLLRFQADFRDIFQVRQFEASTGANAVEQPSVEPDGTIFFQYLDRSNTTLRTRIRLGRPPNLGSQAGEVFYQLRLEPLQEEALYLQIHTLQEAATPGQNQAQQQQGSSRNEPVDVSQAYPERHIQLTQEVDFAHHIWREQNTKISADNEDFNDLVRRSSQDIRMLMTMAQPNDESPLSVSGEHDLFISAGIPWFVTLFGRDSLITARDCLILDPGIARSTLHILAKYQGKTYDAWRDEAPGKILHERRTGELARRGDVPHTPYYGTVDATPLWLVLLHDYIQWTNDTETLSRLWPNALAALGWIRNGLENTPHGYLSYKTTSPKGLKQHGWKDSDDGVVDEWGETAEPPIALCEVQGYVYLARRGMANLAERLGDRVLASALRRENVRFKQRFNRDFWLPELGYCALGLGNRGQPLRVIASNPGHCLETGIFTMTHARQVADRLMQPDCFSGWGIRTLSTQMRAYNPMSYHNGSVWPHDNAMIARGLAAIGYRASAVQVFMGLFEAARLTHYKRLPELFCGFPRESAQNRLQSDPPVRYPVACSPQAWAASAVFSFLQAMLNLMPNPVHHSLIIRRPVLPQNIRTLQVMGLRLGSGETTSKIDLSFQRTDASMKTVMVDVLDRHGPVDILLEI